MVIKQCNRCGEWSDKVRDGMCTKCHTARYNKWLADRRQRSVDQFEAWLKRIRAIPTPYRTLTEEEWLAACKHFGGCAFCGNDSIETRAMFIQYQDGGRYCSWNIVPACEVCSTTRKDTSNPFKKMDSAVNRQKRCPAKRYGMTEANLKKIVEYLTNEIDKEQNG